MDTKDTDSLKATRVTEWTVNQGGYLPLSFGILLIFGCLTAYIIAVLRGNVDPFLPLISDAAGSPPQNGVFGTLICIGGMLGVFFMFLRYLMVLEQNQGKSLTVDTLNKLSLFLGICSMCGITIITGYPANFYRDRDIWMNHVGIPHMVGGGLLFALGLIYIAMQCILTLYLRSNRKLMLFLRVCLCLAATAAFVYHVLTVSDNFGGVKIESKTVLGEEETHTLSTQMPLRDLRLNIDMGETYIPSAISQWLLMLLFCCFFFTFFGEAQEYSLLIAIETSDPDADVNAEVAADDYGEKDGPSTYTRKTSHAFGSFPSGIGYDAANRKNSTAAAVRRDSSCQTRDDMFPKNDLQKNGSRKTEEKAALSKAEKFLESNGESEKNSEANSFKGKNGHLDKQNFLSNASCIDDLQDSTA